MPNSNTRIHNNNSSYSWIRSTVQRFAVFFVVVATVVATGTVPAEAAASSGSDCSIENGLPPRDVHRSAAAASLSYLIYEMGDEAVLTDEDTTLLESNGFSSPKHFVTKLDRGIGARYGNDYCMMSFRGTVPIQVQDVISNLDMRIIEFTSIAQDYYNESYNDFANNDDLYVLNNNDNDDESNTNGTTTTTTVMGCDLHQGYYEAYITFKDEMEEYLDTCVKECPECDVVLTGHSQGGGIAEIYAFLQKKRFLENNNDNLNPPPPPPYVITFGGVQSLGKGCMRFISKEERCNHYHYIQGAPGISKNTLDFDFIPTLMANSYFKARKEGYTADYFYVRNGVAAPGHMILVSYDDPMSSYYLGFDGNYTYRVTDLPFGFNLKTHAKEKYMEILKMLGDNYATGNEPLPTNGFSLDTVCDTGLRLCKDGLECQIAVGSKKQTCRPIGEESSSSSSSSSRIQGGGWLSIASLILVWYCW